MRWSSETSLIRDACTTTESVQLALAPFSSILVLNHDWRPDRRYDMCDSWVGRIIDIRGNSPRNVRSSRSFRSWGRRLTDRRRKIWLIVQWYFSGNDIAERIQAQGDNAGM